MPTASKAKLMAEFNQTFFDFTAATNSGDQKIFTVAGKSLFSAKEGYELDVKPDGIVTGRNLITPGTAAETVDVAAFTVNLGGTEYEVASSVETCTRPAADVACVNTLVATESGGTVTVTVIVGDDTSSGTTLIRTRDGLGGPDYIPVCSAAIGEVHFITHASAVILASEIKQVVGTHTERFDSPTWDEYPTGDGNKAETTAQKNAYIEFKDVIGVGIHTGDAYRAVWVSGYVPVASEVSSSVDFKACKNSHSVSSRQLYNETRGSKSSSLGQGGFTALVDDGITDALVGLEDENITFWFYPNRSKLPYSVTQGYLGLDPTWPADADIEVSATISAAQKTVNFAS